MVLDSSSSSSSSSSISPLPSPSPHMCRSRKDALASDPKPRSPTTPFSPQIRYSSTTTNSTSFPGPSNVTGTGTASSSGADAAQSSTSSATSLASLRLSLPQKPTLYPFSEISAATNNFLSKRLSSTSSSSWRCTLRSKDVVVVQRSFRGGDLSSLPSRLSSLCKSHHSSLIKLLGASLSGEDHIYLVYEYVAGASLQDCLRNPRNPNFTPLSKWLSRMQVATDLADGLDYIHSQCRTIHNRIKSSSVIVTDPKFNAKICHFGAANLAGETPDVEDEKKIAEEGKGGGGEEDEILVEVTSSSPRVRRSGSRPMRIEGTRGYIAPEVIASGEISYKSDVYAFGVVILELISGREPLKYTMNRQTNDYERTSLIETAREVIGAEDEDGASEAEAEADERRGKIRRWVDRRLRDSFPVEVAEKLIRVALRCVEEEAFMRPDTRWIAGKVSRLFLDSQAWEGRVAAPTDFSVSLAPR